MDENGIKNNKYYDKNKVNENTPICYSCGFNETELGPMNMCKVKTKKELIGKFYIKSDYNGDIYINFCINCVLHGFTDGTKKAIDGAKVTGRYEQSNYWKNLK